MGGAIRTYTTLKIFCLENRSVDGWTVSYHMGEGGSFG